MPVELLRHCEIARVMKLNNYRPRNTIEFIAFGSEELGLYGSYAFAGNSRQNLKKIKLMLNNDMIAYQPGSDQTAWIVNINDYDNSHTLRTAGRGYLQQIYSSEIYK